MKHEAERNQDAKMERKKRTWALQKELFGLKLRLAVLPDQQIVNKLINHPLSEEDERRQIEERIKQIKRDPDYYEFDPYGL